MFHKANVENIYRRRNPKRTIESGVGHQENDFSRSQSKGRLPWNVQQLDNVGVVRVHAGFTYLFTLATMVFANFVIHARLIVAGNTAETLGT